MSIDRETWLQQLAEQVVEGRVLLPDDPENHLTLEQLAEVAAQNGFPSSRLSYLVEQGLLLPIEVRDGTSYYSLPSTFDRIVFIRELEQGGTPLELMRVILEFDHELEIFLLRSIGLDRLARVAEVPPGTVVEARERVEQLIAVAEQLDRFRRQVGARKFEDDEMAQMFLTFLAEAERRNAARAELHQELRQLLFPSSEV